MKKSIALFVAIMALGCIVTAVGCGTVNETTRATTQVTTTMQSTTQTTKETNTERTTQTTKIPETETTDVTDTILDPIPPLPDLDDPIIDVEPNIPDSGTTDNGALGDIFEDNDMTQNGVNDNMRNRKKNLRSHEKHDKKRSSDSMMPGK